MVPPAPADRRRRRPGPRLPAQPGLRRRGGAPVPAGVGARRLGRAVPGAGAERGAGRRAPASASSTGGAGCRTPSGPGSCSPSATRPAIRWPSGAGSCPAAPTRPSTRTRSETPDLLQAADPLRPQLGQAGHHQVRRGGGVRGVHRRHRLLRGRGGAGGGHLRHGPGRGAREAAAAASPPGWCWPSTPTGPASRPPAASTSGSGGSRSTWPWPPCPPAPTRASWPGPTPTALRAAIEGAKPFLQFRLERILDAGRPVHPRGAGPGGRRRPGRGGRAPRQPGPRPVPDAGGRAVPPRAGARCATASSSSAREGPRPAPGGRNGLRRAGGAGGQGRPTAAGRPWVREPEDGDWDADGFDGGGVPVGRHRRAATGGRRRRPGRTTASSGPGSRPCAWPSTGPTMSATGWRRPCSATSCSGPPSRRWSDADDLHEAIDAAPPEVRALLVRLTVEEPRGEPDDVVAPAGPGRGPPRADLITGEARTSPDGGRGGRCRRRLGPGAGRSRLPRSRRRPGW